MPSCKVAPSGISAATRAATRALSLGWCRVEEQQVRAKRGHNMVDRASRQQRVIAGQWQSVVQLGHDDAGTGHQGLCVVGDHAGRYEPQRVGTNSQEGHIHRDGT